MADLIELIFLIELTLGEHTYQDLLLLKNNILDLRQLPDIDISLMLYDYSYLLPYIGEVHNY